MPTTVIAAFNTFQKNIINLDPDRNKTARKSRDWLISNIESFTNFFPIYSDKNIYFGSFARRTKIKPLDDIDIMVAMNANGCNYSEDVSGQITINIPDECNTYKPYRHSYLDTLNSIKVVNEFVRKLSDIDQYKDSTIKRNQEAAVLNLKSYDWAFDIVPCFFTTEDSLGRAYYVIPDGNGNWKKTDPRKDRDRVTTINKACDSNMLNVLRLIKYWQRRKTMPSMGSYLIECMILNYYESKESCSQYQDLELVNLFNYIAKAIYHDVVDPKGIQGNINQISLIDKIKISIKASGDAGLASEAIAAENDSDYKKSINKWRQIFGNDFPEYG